LVSHHSHREVKEACGKAMDCVQNASAAALDKGLERAGDAQVEIFGGLKIGLPSAEGFPWMAG
jgi:hypothetical protein